MIRMVIILSLYQVIAPKDPFLVQQEEGAGLMGASFDERKGFVVKVYTLLSL